MRTILLRNHQVRMHGHKIVGPSGRSMSGGSIGARANKPMQTMARIVGQHSNGPVASNPNGVGFKGYGQSVGSGKAVSAQTAFLSGKACGGAIPRSSIKKKKYISF